MNIFVLDYDITKCAQAHMDKHVTKMILESAQLLCTAKWVTDILGYSPEFLTPGKSKIVRDAATKARPLKVGERVAAGFPSEYLPFGINHPSCIWVRSSRTNWAWMISLTEALQTEAQYRGFKPHKSMEVLRAMPIPEKLVKTGLTPFGMSMPEDYKQSDPIEAYRLYYHLDKEHIATWTKRGAPDWWIL